MIVSKKLRSHSTRILLFAVVALLLLGCEKYSSPRKVKRIITKDKWRFTSVFVDNTNMSTDFQNYTFSFSADGDITVGGDPTISGKWDTGIERNPTTLELTLTPFAPFHHLNADWTVVTIKAKRITLELDTAAGKDQIVMSKVI